MRKWTLAALPARMEAELKAAFQPDAAAQPAQLQSAIQQAVLDTQVSPTSISTAYLAIAAMTCSCNVSCS